MKFIPAIDRYIFRLVLMPMLAVFIIAAMLLMLDKMLKLFDFVASMGLRMIMSAARSLRSRNARLAVYGAQRPVNDVFEQVSFGQIVPVRSTEAEALVAVALSPV